MSAKEDTERIIDDEEESGDGDCQHIFPQRLMSILADERNHDAICWLPHGRAFIIRNRALFAERVMPKFFPRKSKYSSFTRKLNRWYVEHENGVSRRTQTRRLSPLLALYNRNFNRVSSGPELGSYYHEFFLRDKPHLAAQMFCKNARTKIAMASPDPSPTAAMATNKFDAQAAVAGQQQPQPQQKEQSGMDAAQMFLAGHQMDPAMQFLLEQQLLLGRQHLSAQLRLHQEPRMHLLRAPVPVAATSLALEMEIQKQQQEHLIQLQQLIAMNRLKGQQKRKNNFRASAA